MILSSYLFALSALIRPSCSHQLRYMADVYRVEQKPPQTGEQTLMKASWCLLEVRLFPLTNLSEFSKCESENVNGKSVLRWLERKQCKSRILTHNCLHATISDIAERCVWLGLTSRVNKHELKPFRKFCREPRCLMSDGHDDDDEVVLPAAAVAAAEAGPHFAAKETSGGR